MPVKCAFVAKGINVACRTIDGDAFIFKEDTRELMKLDRVGSFIWDQINGVRTVDQIVERCCAFFEGNEPEMTAGITDFVATLIESGVAVESDGPFTGVMASAC